MPLHSSTTSDPGQARPGGQKALGQPGHFMVIMTVRPSATASPIYALLQSSRVDDSSLETVSRPECLLESQVQLGKSFLASGSDSDSLYYIFLE